MCWSSQPFLSAINPNLQAQDISHGLGGFFLCRSGNMRIGIQGEACGEVTQHAGHCFNVHSVLEGNGSEGVAEVVESELRDASSLQHSLEHVVDAVRGDGSAIGRGKHIPVIDFPFLFPQDFDCLGEMLIARYECLVFSGAYCTRMLYLPNRPINGGWYCVPIYFLRSLCYHTREYLFLRGFSFIAFHIGRKTNELRCNHHRCRSRRHLCGV